VVRGGKGVEAWLWSGGYVPRDDGSGSGEQIEGSIKGPGAVAQITPRLRELLSKRR
jgi:hypothetical protein